MTFASSSRRAARAPSARTRPRPVLPPKLVQVFVPPVEALFPVPAVMARQARQVLAPLCARAARPPLVASFEAGR